MEAYNFATLFHSLQRFEEAKTLLRKTIPVARRVFGDSKEITLTMRKLYATTLRLDRDATLDDLNEAVTTLEEIEPTARRVLGGAHPDAMNAERELRYAQLRAALRSREDTQPSPGSG